MGMGKKPRTQKTPKGHEIPIPTKEEFEKNLEKVMKPKPTPPRNSPKD
jgi:hypothetical protein